MTIHGPQPDPPEPEKKIRRRMMPAAQLSAILAACTTVARLQEQVERGGLVECAEATQELASKINLEAGRLLGAPKAK